MLRAAGGGDDAVAGFLIPRATGFMKDDMVSITGVVGSRELPRSGVPAEREGSMAVRSPSIAIASGATWVTGAQELRCPEPIKPSFLESEEDDCADVALGGQDADAEESSVWFQVEVRARLAAIDARVKSLAMLEGKIDHLLKLAKEQAERPMPVVTTRTSVRRGTFNLTGSSRTGSKRAMPHARQSISQSPSASLGGRASFNSAIGDGRVSFNSAIGDDDRLEDTAADDGPVATENSANPDQADDDKPASTREVLVDVDSRKVPSQSEGTNTEYSRRKSSTAVKAWEFFEDEESSRYARFYARMMFPFIIATVMVSLAQAIDEPVLRDNIVVQLVEVCIEVIFLIEVVARTAATRSWRACLADFYNMIDVVSVLPLVLRSVLGLTPFDANGSCSVACAVLLGFVPVLRLLKLLRRFQNFQLLLRAFKLAFEALPVLLYIWAILGLLAAAGLYLAEPRDNVATLGVSIWLSVVSMTTLGYGDFYPVSVLGRLIVCLLVLCSALYMAIPLGIIGSAFSEVWSDRFRILLTERTRKRLQQAGYHARDIPFLFEQFDSDRDGCLDMDEFRTMVDFMQVGFNGMRVIELFEMFDSDGSGAIDDREFVRAVFPESFHDVYGAILKQTGQACVSCGNMFMQDSKFCRKCGTQRPSMLTEKSEGDDGEVKG